MIKGNLKDYKNIIKSEPLNRGLDFLSSAKFSKLEDGRYELSGEDYVNIQTYTTKSDANYEAHRNYIDIQYMISGQEYIGVADYNSFENIVPYDKEKDIEFLKGSGENYILNQGEFMILYPQDAHRPSVSIDVNNPVTVRKAVVKIKI